MKKHVVLVPTDFSKVADCALNHAVTIAKTINGEIKLLHVVEKQKQVDENKEKLESLASKTTSESGVEVNGVIRVGNIFEDIGDAAAELGAKLILMGTHGVKGFQHITGSYALKVITNSKVPFIVVQEKGPDSDGYKNIVLPLDLARETKQKLTLAADIAQYFGSKIHIIVPNAKDEDLVRQLKGNILFAKKYLTDNKVAFVTKVAEDSNFRKEIIKYAVNVDADLISIMNMDEGILGGGDVQATLTNEPQIPAMVINPKQIGTGGGAGLFS